MLEKIWSFKLARFLCVGIFNTLFDLTILNTLVFLVHFPYLLANVISATASMTVSYFLNHHIVFQSSDKHNFTRFARFFAVTGFGILAIQTSVIYIVNHLLSLHPKAVHNIINDLHLTHFSIKAFDLNIAKLWAVIVALIWNFTIYHIVVFKTKNQELEKDILI